MKKIFFVIFLFFIIPINCFSLSISSSSLVAMDIDSGRVFYDKNGEQKRLIASTTKIMTAIVAIEEGNLTDIVEAGDEVLTMYGSNIYLEYQESMILLDLLYGLMLRSGNDASVVIARHVGGSIDNFVNLMNKKAHEIGMMDSLFNNPHGLDEETKNYSTAYDLCLLYKYAWNNKVFREIAGTKTYKTSTLNKSYAWKNRADILFSYEKSTGAKTGYTPSAKKVLVSSASNTDLDVVISSFNYDYDYVLQEKMFEEIFKTYKKQEILNPSKFQISSDYDGKVYIKNSFYYPIKSEEEDDIILKVKWYDKKTKDNIVGEVYVYLDDEIIHTEYLYLLESKVSLKEKIINFFEKIF